MWDMITKLGSSLPPPSDERFLWFESVYRISLPTSFILLLKESNGGIPVANRFLQGCRERMIERLLCLLDKPSEDQVHGWYDITVVLTQIETRLTSDQDLLGANVIPFAALFGGDFACLDFRNSSALPVVSVWDHERSDDWMPQLEEVAPTLEAFEQSLKQ